MSFSGNTTKESTTTVMNDGWWPDLSIADFEKRYRLPSDYEEMILVDGLQLGMAWANKQLKSWREGLTEFDYENLAAVPSDSLGGESVKLIHYRRAVYCHAKAFLLNQFSTINRREAARNEARESDETESTFLAHAQHAIASFKDESSVTVGLI